MRVKQIAENEPAPSAENWKEATENCQGWAVRVVAKLVEERIVPVAKLEMARSIVKPF